MSKMAIPVVLYVASVIAVSTPLMIGTLVNLYITGIPSKDEALFTKTQRGNAANFTGFFLSIFIWAGVVGLFIPIEMASAPTLGDGILALIWDSILMFSVFCVIFILSAGAVSIVVGYFLRFIYTIATDPRYIKSWYNQAGILLSETKNDFKFVVEEFRE